MAENRQPSWIGWIMAALLGTAVIAPQVGGEKSPPAPPAASGQKAANQGLGTQDRYGASDLENTTLRPLVRFLEKLGEPSTHAVQEATIRGEANKPVWELKGAPFTNLEEMRKSWSAAHELERKVGKAQKDGTEKKRGPHQGADGDGTQDLMASPHLRLLLASLPDPEYPDLLPIHDLYLRAMKEQIHRMGWLFAGHWYPEMDTPGKAPEAFRHMPRSILFSRPLQTPVSWAGPEPVGPKKAVGESNPARENHELLLVLLVPENPTRGIDRLRLRRALKLVNDWQHSVHAKDSAAVRQRYENAQDKANQDGRAFQSWLDGWLDGLKAKHEIQEETSNSLSKLVRPLIRLPKPGESWDEIEKETSNSPSKRVRPLIRLPKPGESWDEWLAQLQSFPETVKTKSTPKSVVSQFEREARSFVDRLWSRVTEASHYSRHLRFLGPHYSSSAQALAEELSPKAGFDTALGALVISPGSSIPSVRGKAFWPARVEAVFLPPDDDSLLMTTVSTQFREDLTGSGDRWAEIDETDTAFGGVSGSWSSSHPSDQGLTYKLPSNLTSLRRAKGGSDADPLAGLGGPLRSALARLRPLSIDWTAEGASPELAPLDPHPAVTLDLEFQALVQDLKVRGIKGVFISMSSLQNALFIARQLRMHLPDLIIAMDWLHAELLHPDLAGDLEGIYVFSLHSPYPDLWRLSADSQDQTHVKPISPPEEKPTPLAQASAPLVQDALWLLENAAQNPKGGWQIAQVPDTPSKAPWSKRPDGDWTLRRPRYVSQLRHGQFRPVKAALEQENGQGNAEDVVHFKDAGFPWPNHIPRSADFLSVDVSYLRMGRIQRFCLPLLAIGLLLFAFRRNRKQQANLEMGASIGVQTCQAPAQLVLMILLGTVLLCTQVTCLHACLGVLWLLGGRGLFPWVEMLLFLGSCGGILWIAAGTAGRRVLTLLEATRTPFIARLRDGQGQVFLSPGWIQLATGCLMAAPALFILGQRGWEDFHPDSSGDRFAPAFHALAALEPFTGLAYLSTLLIICVFMALAIHLEGLRAFHQQRNLNLVTPEKVSGTPLQTPTEQRTKATRGWSLAACLLLPMLLYLPLLFEGGFRAVRLIPLQGVMSWIIGLGFIGLAGYAVWQYWMAWQEWRGLKIRSIALEVAPWRDAYEEVGRLYPWRPARSLSFFGKDNRSLPFKVLEEILAKSADPPLDLGLPELHGIRASIQKLADARTNQAEEARIVRDLDLELSGIFKRMDAKASYRNRQALALHTYLFFRRRLWDVKYRIYLSLLASFCLLFAGSEGLQASQSLMLLALTGIGLQLLLALRLILDLEGNGLFSAVAGTAPGKANWNQDTWSALMKPAALALLALLVARFPGLSAAAAGMLLH